jgi:UDP-N-acetylglucosamine 1-carboxyvinyltransferase
MAALLATADGTSSIRENIFDLRLQYANELVKMGAKVRLLDARTAEIAGVPRLHGAEIEAHNIRDGAALLVAALGAEGESIVSGRRYVARGYEEVDVKLRSLGAEITNAEN